MSLIPTGAQGNADERIIAWEHRTRALIILAALAPFLPRLLPGSLDALNLGVDVVAWGIFAADFVVHLRIKPAYWRTGSGLFDEAILFLTFPWYLFPSLGSTAYMAVFRWARVARLLFAGDTGRRVVIALRRLGALGVALAISSVFAGLVVLRHEPAEAGFDTFGDALWWALVSFTTVGYGDLYPTTSAGRVAGALMMFMGLLALGTVSGVLASTFTGDPREEEPPESGGALTLVLGELQQLRGEVADLRLQLGRAVPGVVEDPTPEQEGPA
jgi:voltage-gated potassium channel